VLGIDLGYEDATALVVGALALFLLHRAQRARR